MSVNAPSARQGVSLAADVTHARAITLPSALPEIDDPVAVDTETSGLYPDDGARVAVVSVAWENEDGTVTSHTFPFDQGRRDQFPQIEMFEEDVNLPEEEWHTLMAWLLRHKTAWWNAYFDLLLIRAGTRHYPGYDLVSTFLWDGMLAGRDLDPTLPSSLKETSARLALWGGGEREYEEAVKMALGEAHIPAGRYDLLPWAAIAPYAAGDADLTIRNFHKQWQRYEEGEGSYSHLQKDFRLMQVLVEMESRGIGYDAKGSWAAHQELDQWERKIVRDLPFNPSIESARRYFFMKAPELMQTFTNTGRARLDTQAVNKLVAAGVPYADEFALIRKIRTAKTKWYKPYAEACDGDGRIRTRYRQARVVSGRLSAERVNLQAIPHDYQLGKLLGRVPSVRALFRADGGRRSSPKRLWELDLEQAELRCAARMANCESMLRLIAQGADLHGEVAKQLFDCDPSQSCWFEHRQIGKRGDFAFIFDVGAETFQSTLAKLADIYLELHECESIVHGWRALYPEYKQAVYYWHRVAERKGWLRLANGRIRWFAAWEDFHKAFNQKVQGSLAELLKQWMIAVDSRWPGVLVLTIHDSLVLETQYQGIVKRAAALGAQLGTQMLGVPMEVEIKQWK